MEYLDLYRFLKSTVRPGPPVQLGDGLWATHLDFASDNGLILPGESHYTCSTHGALDSEAEAIDPQAGFLDLHDSQVMENREFNYSVFHGAQRGRAREILLLFHGLNEKEWHKYLPWAHRLALTTGKAVVLFPIAFHMNRALPEWSDHRLMHRVCEKRKKTWPEVVGASLSNVAVSTRLHARPQRFIWSGLETYFDVVQLLHEIRADRIPLIDPGATTDILAYSVGGLLAQTLMMTNPEGLFDRSRLCLFCAGAVFNRMSPVSKFILDSEANVALYSYVVEHLESHLRHDARLRHYLGGQHPEGLRFRSMLNYGVMRKEREARFRELAPRLLAVPLEQDKVIPPYEVVNALQGSTRDLPVRVERMDFPYEYQHEDPFPAREALRAPVDQAFRQVFDLVAEFYRS
ncbi:MAG: DUF6051 family protein [Holophaga sp.]|nr:DUF6051 family protein [Holophaga sp.]